MHSKRCLLLMGLLVLAACGRGIKDYEPYSTSERTLFMPSVRTAAGEPVYRRTRWVQLPEVLPDREMPGEDSSHNWGVGPAIRPIFHLSLKNTSLEETARVLAAMARYASYVAPSIASQKVSVENLGTLDELGAIVARKAQIEVVVDHENKEVRFLAPSTEQPELYSE